MRNTGSQNMQLRPPRRSGLARTGVAIVLSAASAVLSAGALGGCRGERSDEPPRQFLPDMDSQARVRSQTATPFFEDGRSARKPVAGTVPFGRVIGVNAESDEAWTEPWVQARRAMLREGLEEFHGITADGRFLDRIPASVRVDEATLLRGREQFNIFCAVCHGYDGAGRGTVGVRWSVPAANLHDPKYLDLAQRTGKDGYLFDVIRNGVWDNVEIEDGRVLHYSATGTPENPGQWRMAGYRSKVSEHDAWAIVAYLRMLQEGRAHRLEDVPDAGDRDRLRDRWERRAQPATNGAEGGTQDQVNAGAGRTEMNG